MEELLFSYAASGVSSGRIRQLSNQLIPEIKKVQQEVKKGYDTDYAALFLPEDDTLLEPIEKLAQQVLSYNPTMVILIGIGGSNLGTLAVMEALYGDLYNNTEPHCSFYSADTIDSDKNTQLLRIMEQELMRGGKVIVIVISKSGKTTETIVNAALYCELLKKYYPQEYRDFIVIITDAYSALYTVAQEYAYALLEIPSKVGGRYSVLSAVGLFPLALMGIDCTSLLSGALAMRTRCLQEDRDTNYAALSALIIYVHYKQGKNIHDTFLFSPDLALLGAWYKQLVGESLGKSYSTSGILVEAGITPTVSIGTTDLHSVAQLYLGGPRDKITTFVSINRESALVKVPDNEFIEPLPFLRDKSIAEIKGAIYTAVTRAYKHQECAFMELTLQRKDAFSLGQFFMMKMCEVIYLAKLLEVNPFDQPAVELYKEETRKILSV